SGVCQIISRHLQMIAAGRRKSIHSMQWAMAAPLEAAQKDVIDGTSPKRIRLAGKVCPEWNGQMQILERRLSKQIQTLTAHFVWTAPALPLHFPGRRFVALRVRRPAATFGAGHS